MNETSDNPPSNKIGPNTDEKRLIEAIARSGYPLQAVVADILKKSFSVSEEWGYVDRDTQEHRSLDIFAFKRLADETDMQPNVALLIECKRSVHPYVFFRSVIGRDIPDFPKFVGLPSQHKYLWHKSRGVMREVAVQRILGLHEFSFVRPGPIHCPSFASAQASGQKIALSGGDCFNGLILPLVKAVDQATALYGEAAQGNAAYIHPTLILAVGVIDAPMLVVNSPHEVATPILTPWVRVPRHEMNQTGGRDEATFYGIDLVHSDFFETFVSQNLTLFLNEFWARVREQSKVLRRGGSVDDLDNWEWHQIAPR